MINEIGRKSCSFWSTNTKYLKDGVHKRENHRIDCQKERVRFQLEKLWNFTIFDKKISSNWNCVSEIRFSNSRTCTSFWLTKLSHLAEILSVCDHDFLVKLKLSIMCQKSELKKKLWKEKFSSQETLWPWCVIIGLMFRPVYHFRQESRQIVNCVSESQNMEMESFSTQETLIRTSKCFELSLCFSDCFVATATLSKQKILTRRIPQSAILLSAKDSRSSPVLESKVTKC